MPTIAQFLQERLSPLVNHIFGIPGDYVLELYDFFDSQLDVCNLSDEQGAGFAADAYARVHGFGAVCVTYCVGGFKILNPIAGAFAEKSPVLVISGAPGTKERNKGLQLHHCAGAYDSQHDMFKNITCATAVLDDPVWAAHEIERVVAAIQHYKQPGYIEIPRDMFNKNVRYDVYTQGTPISSSGDQENLNEALQKSAEWIANSKNPVILAGVELARFGFGYDVIKFAEQHNIPVATSILGKSVVNEHHPLCVGVYAGRMSQDYVRSVVEQSDCVIQLGVLQTDMNLGFQPFQCDKTNVIMANTDRVRIRRSTYENVPFSRFVEEFLKIEPKNQKASIDIPKKSVAKFIPEKDKQITSKRLFDKIDSILDESHTIIADVGDSLFGATDLTVRHQNNFLAQAFYTSMGNSVPGAVGVQLAQPDVRPIVIVGDGAFQMTGMEVSTIVRRGLNPIIFVLNNNGYGTERRLGYDGRYNDVHPWNYHMMVEVVAGGTGWLVKTEEDLEDAVKQALENKSLSLINVVVDKMDATPALLRMTEHLSKQL